jgi:hypothetical protein
MIRIAPPLGTGVIVSNPKQIVFEANIREVESSINPFTID